MKHLNYDDNPAEILRDLIVEQAEEQGLEVDHQSIDEWVEYLQQSVKEVVKNQTGEEKS